jgi:predicted alpha/beta hydrolase family esterase
MSLGSAFLGSAFLGSAFLGSAFGDPPNSAPDAIPTSKTPETELAKVLSSALRDGLQGRQNGEICELQRGPKWMSADRDLPSVILVPGLFGSNGSMKRIHSELERSGLAVAVFRYADQLAIDLVSEELFRTLRQLERDDPSRSICLVTHSLGGLVARAAIESEGYSLRRVGGLVMVAPPNHGTALAAWDAKQLGQLFGAESNRKGDFELVNEIVGGFIGQAKDSLRPDSEFLALLNQRPRMPGIRYTIVAGTGGPIDPALTELPLLLTDLLLGGDPGHEQAMAPVRKLAATEEWIKGRGDGVVSLKSTRLRGVDDRVLLPFAHNDFGSDRLDQPHQRAVDQVAKIVIERVKQSAKQH